MNKHIYFGQTIAEVINVKDKKAFLSLTFVTALALAGVITVASLINKQQAGKTPFVDLNENESTTENVTGGQVIEITTPNDEDESTSVTQSLVENTDESTAASEKGGESEGVAVDVEAVPLMFKEGDALGWPVEGNVILEFSMNGSVYFATLDQYKYNPAMLIQSEVNTPVKAATDCVVKKIGTNEEIGTYVIMSIGSDYELTYGQLKSLTVSEGDSVAEGEIIGYVAEPTKYYVVEGCNLYVKLTKGDIPVDPLDYIR